MGTGRDQDIRRRPRPRGAEQPALKAQRDPERIKFEADRKIASAKVEAESLRLQKGNVTPEGNFVPFDSHFFRIRRVYKRSEQPYYIYGIRMFF